MVRRWVLLLVAALAALWLLTTWALATSVMKLPASWPKNLFRTEAKQRRILLGVYNRARFADLIKHPHKTNGVSVHPSFISLSNEKIVQDTSLVRLDESATNDAKALAFFAAASTEVFGFFCVEVGDGVDTDVAELAKAASDWPEEAAYVSVPVFCGAEMTCVSDQFHCVSRDVAQWVATKGASTTARVGWFLNDAKFPIVRVSVPWSAQSTTAQPTTASKKATTLKAQKTAVPEETKGKTTKPLVAAVVGKKKNTLSKGNGETAKSGSVAVVTMQCSAVSKIERTTDSPLPTDVDTEENKCAWACQHGYKLFVEKCNAFIPGRAPVWGGVAALLRHFDEAEYLVWIDNSVLIVDHDVTVATLVAGAKTGANLFMVGDKFDIFVLRSSEWSRNFLDSVLRVRAADSTWHRQQVQRAMEVTLASLSEADRLANVVKVADLSSAFAAVTEANFEKLRKASAKNEVAAEESCRGIVVCSGETPLPKACVDSSFVNQLPKPIAKARPVCIVTERVRVVHLAQKFGADCDWVLIAPAGSVETRMLMDAFKAVETEVTLRSFSSGAEYRTALELAIADYEEMFFVREAIVLPHAGWSLKKFISAITCKGPVGFSSLTKTSTVAFYARTDYFHFLVSEILSESHFVMAHQSMCSAAAHFFDWWDPRVTGCVEAPPLDRDMLVPSDRSGHSNAEKHFRSTFPILQKEPREAEHVVC